MIEDYHEYITSNLDLRRSIKKAIEEEYSKTTKVSGEEQGTVIVPTDLKFVSGQPSCLYEEEDGIPYRGQDHIKKILDITISTLEDEARFKALLSGPAGTGKTTLAWIIASRIQMTKQKKNIPIGRFFELLPAQVESKAELDVFMKQLQPHDIVFIDEIHILKNNVGAEPLYHTLDDTGTPRYPLGNNQGWVEIHPTISWIGATTEPGELDGTTGGALRRRLSPELRLEAPSLDVLVSILKDQGMHCEDDAAREIARRSGGLPWQVLEIYSMAHKFAMFEGRSKIDMQVATDTFTTMGVDRYGLFSEDRSVINVLLQSPYKMRGGEIRYKMSEAALCSAAGIDKQTYKHIVQPRLMRLGFLTTVGGQCLTQRTLDIFNDTSRKTNGNH